MPDISNWELNDDHTHVVLNLPTNPPCALSMDAAEVDRMIAGIAKLRAAMKTKRPMADPAPGTEISVTMQGRWWVQADVATGGILLALLHSGYGWVGIQLSQAETTQLVQTILRYRPTHLPNAGNLPRTN